MDQKQFWEIKWQKGEYRPASNFAKRTWQYIKNNNYKTLLDLGCGNGNDAIYFHHKGLEVAAIDISDIALAMFKSRKGAQGITISQGDLTNLSFPDSSYDVIYANLSLHYFDDPTTRKVFRTLHQILKPGGLIFVKCKSDKDKRNGKTERFYNFFTPSSMRDYLRDYKNIKIKQTSSVYNEYKSSYIEAIATKQ